jgi:hypothetical protein
MSLALVAPASPALDPAFVRELARILARCLRGLLQAMLFAASLWLIAAGPGCLADSASTVPNQTVTGR